MTSFLAVEAKAFLLAATMFFGSKFVNFDKINVYCIRITGRFQGGGVWLDMGEWF